MNEKRFIVETVAVREKVITDNEKCYSYEDLDEIVDKLNEQQDQISYWKHKVSSLLWILGQFDEEKVKGLLKEIEDE